jgi:hypothetical protein
MPCGDAGYWLDLSGRQPPWRGRPCVRGGGWSGGEVLHFETAPAASAAATQLGKGRPPAQVPERPAGSTDLDKPRSVLEPRGSQIASRSISGASFANSFLIRTSSSSSDMLSIAERVLMSPADFTARSAACL